ncbi:MAG: polysaccharide ABC transporter ATP-binding protein [Actinobacteria bacterium]|nr:polysaccharide ABC transporter ATP-binding protein [Actinomycetota bacterium]
MSTVIEVENLGKKYIISHQLQQRYIALRDVIADGTKKLFSRRNQSISKREMFWALREVSFIVNQGDRIGIIGRNGAGKTTVLKILSRVTEPSEGIVKIKGRVSSLLEVGTGFHPELTGRENIYFNGAILGMTRKEIKKKFDEIVDFAEVEKFLDTPVKRYSSGMYVRLAFAVAAHLDSEILLVDEVLAVGDSQFQKKCLGKMDDVSSKEGRTVLFVSHNMAIIRNLCTRGILFSNGKIQYSGDVEDAISKYEYDNPNENTVWNNPKNMNDCVLFDVESISVLDSKMNNKKNYYNSEKILVRIDFFAKEIHSQMKIQLFIIKYGEIAFTYPIFIYEKYKISSGRYRLFCEIPANLLSPGNYFLTVDVSLYNIQGIAIYDHILNFEVIMDKMEYMPHLENIPGYVFPVLEWYIES